MAVNAFAPFKLLFKINTVLHLARSEATPEGQARKKEKERYAAMLNDELVKAIEVAEKEDAERIVGLLDERALELPNQ